MPPEELEDERVEVRDRARVAIRERRHAVRSDDMLDLASRLLLYLRVEHHHKKECVQERSSLCCRASVREVKRRT